MTEKMIDAYTGNYQEFMKDIMQAELEKKRL
jgi:hypothetical protein